MPTWVCEASGKGCGQCPAALAKTFLRGSRFRAAAWTQRSDEQFAIAYAVELPEGKDAKGARVEFQKQLNAHSGAVGTKLPGAALSITHVGPIDTPLKVLLARVPRCTIIRDFAEDCAVVALPPAPMQPLTPEERDRSLVLLGVGPDATLDEIKSSYRKLVRLCHPDKVDGQRDMFVAIHHAYQQVCQGIGPGADDPVEAILTPKMNELAIGSSYDEIAVERTRLSAYREQLIKELSRVDATLRVFDGMRQAKQKQEIREAAVAFTQRFRMSASLWDPLDLERWFQKGRYQWQERWPSATAQWLAQKGFPMLEAEYGPDLRGSCNADLDPYLRFDRWFPMSWPPGARRRELLYGSSKLFQVRVGLDHADAARFGHTLFLPFAVLQQGAQHRQRLGLSGFSVRAADRLLGGIKYRGGGLGIDVFSALQIQGSEQIPAVPASEEEDDDDAMRRPDYEILEQ